MIKYMRQMIADCGRGGRASIRILPTTRAGQKMQYHFQVFANEMK